MSLCLQITDTALSQPHPSHVMGRLKPFSQLHRLCTAGPSIHFPQRKLILNHRTQPMIDVEKLRRLDSWKSREIINLDLKIAKRGTMASI